MKGRFALRYWATVVLALLAMLVVAFLGLVIGDRLLPTSIQEQRLAQSRRREALVQLLRTNADRWSDPEFQQALRDQSTPVKGYLILYDSTGRTIFATDPGLLWNPATGSPSVSQTQTGRVGSNSYVLAVPYPEFLPDVLVNVLPIDTGLAFLGVVGTLWVLTRMLTRPLLALTRAADRLSHGDWDVEVPASRVRELNQLGQSFARMRDSLQLSMDQQARMEQERRSFIASISHDLRTPLFSIRGYLKGLLDGVARTPEQVERYLTVCADQAAILDRMVEDLFAFSKLEYLEQEIRPEPVRVAELLENAVTGMGPRAGQRGVILTYMLEPGAPQVLLVDHHFISRAVDNLLDNAIRHTPPGGRVTVAALPGPALRISDTGEGIAPADLPHIFKPLYRADPARQQSTGGAGMGLAIAQRIVEAHGGQITVTSTPGAGTTFHLTFPDR